MTEVKIFAIHSQFLGEFTANFKDSYSQAYSPMCESSITALTYWIKICSDLRMQHLKKVNQHFCSVN